MLIRLIVFIALISLILFVYRKLTAPKQPSTTAKSSEEMKKCAHCGVHLPKNEAIEEDDLYFCSKEHKNAHLEKHHHD